MIRSTLGAPFGGTTEGGQYGFESAAMSLITPPNLGSGGGSCLPSMVVVALGAPGVPVICCACANAVAASKVARNIPLEICLLFMVLLLLLVVIAFFTSPARLHSVAIASIETTATAFDCAE